MAPAAGGVGYETISTDWSADTRAVGFPPSALHHSSADEIVEYVAEAGFQVNQTTAVFLYVEKAFDRVWHQGLLYEHQEVHLPDCYIRLIASFLRERIYRVRIDHALSSERRITAGVPQGVLGLLQFSVFVNDVPKVP